MNYKVLEVDGVKFYEATTVDHVVGLQMVDIVTLEREIEAKNKEIAALKVELKILDSAINGVIKND